MCQHCGCGHGDHEHTHIMLPVKGLTAEDADRLSKALNELSGVHAAADHNIGAVSLLLHEDGDLTEVKKIIARIMIRE